MERDEGQCQTSGQKGISGLKHFASKLSEVVPDEPVEPEEEPPAEDAAIPVSAPPEVPEGLYDPEPEPEGADARVSGRDGRRHERQRGRARILRPRR